MLADNRTVLEADEFNSVLCRSLDPCSMQPETMGGRVRSKHYGSLWITLQQGFLIPAFLEGPHARTIVQRTGRAVFETTCCESCHIEKEGDDESYQSSKSDSKRVAITGSHVANLGAPAVEGPMPAVRAVPMSSKVPQQEQAVHDRNEDYR